MGNCVILTLVFFIHQTNFYFVKEYCYMKIIVVGCGKIGSQIVATLAHEGHNVVAVDENPAVVDSITNIYDVMGVCGGGADCEVLAEAGVDKAELFISAAGSDELNMLSCFIAKRMGAKHTIARIRNPHYNDKSLNFMRENLGLAMAINPELLAAHEIFNILKIPAAAKIESFSRRHFEMIELNVKDGYPFVGLPVAEIRNKYSANFIICAVQRGDKTYIPDGNFTIKSGDRIALAAAHLQIQKLLKEMGLLRKQAKNIMILGGSRTSIYLAKMLTSVGNSVKIIEKSGEKCSELNDSLAKAVIVHGDGASQELLLEEGLHQMDAFIALTGMDEVNILMSIFASTNEIGKVISKINTEELTSVAKKLGLDSLISPKKAVSDVIVRYARALKETMESNIETLYSFLDGTVEALEFKVSHDSKLIGIPIYKLNLKKGILIAGIIRNRKPIIPTGNDTFIPGDRVVVIAADHHLSEFADIVKHPIIRETV